MATTNKQDRQGARTPADLEQRYRFGESFAEAMGLAKDAQVVATAAKEATDKLDNSLNSDEIFNRLTENGALQGLYKEDGNLYINASYIKSGKISTVHTKTYYATDYTEADLERMQQIMIGAITPTEEDYERYDLYGDGAITGTEFVTIRNMLLGVHEWTKVTWYVEIEPSSKKNAIRTYYTVENNDRGIYKTVETFNVGVGGVSALVIEHSKMEGILSFAENEGLGGLNRKTSNGEREYLVVPLDSFIEYRTTERWLNKPVYTKLVKCDALPNSSGDFTLSKEFSLQINATEIISVNAYGFNSAGERIPLPYINEFGEVVVWYRQVIGNPNALDIFSKIDASAYSAYFQVKYTKD